MNELALGWAKLVLAGVGTVVSGLVLYYIKRLVDRKDSAERYHASAHRRYERNFIKIDDHCPEFKLDVEE